MPIREQGRRMRLRRTGTILPEARIRHYDELGDDAQATVAELAGRPRTAAEASDLEDGDVVKFTDYYVVRAR
ncbi:hypothetical protein J2751_002362 [Halorubrum alkaliphilum]|uniref:DUF7979 domain-containing protein n=1 Tax=Halorubrum alkaliphilum TaxID=261290 RepID=A0A8T4GGP4_9EURY|nr:hypothetical protein [Halorubrum alkaliphilum]MBP1923323.1 hypothetical protein [Halorubrum alkaliphilum]